MNENNITLTQIQVDALDCLFRVFPLNVAIDTMTKAYGEKAALEVIGTVNALCGQIGEVNATIGRAKKLADTAAKLAERRSKARGNGPLIRTDYKARAKARAEAIKQPSPKPPFAPATKDDIRRELNHLESMGAGDTEHAAECRKALIA